MTDAVVNEIIEFLNSATSDYSYRTDQDLSRLLTRLMEVSKQELAECYALKTITKVIKCYSKYRMFILIELFSPHSLIYSLCEGDYMILKGEFFIHSILDCIDAIVTGIDTLMTESEMMAGKTILRFLCRMHYWDKFNTSQFPRIVLHSLILVKKLISLFKEDFPQHIGEVLGICMTYMFLGNSVKEKRAPRKLLPSSLNFTNFTEDLKPVQVNTQEKMYGKFLKPKKNRIACTKILSSNVSETSHKHLMAEEYSELTPDIQENCKKGEVDIKIRIASIDLLGDMVRGVQHHILYSYWQSLFPCDIEENKNVRRDILLVSETDDCHHCRFAALQVCTYLFLNCKSLFIPAEYRYRSAAFIPHSQKLGLSILAVSNSLMITITKETSVKVLIQALKCTSALVQVTDFTRFECRLIHNIMHVIRELVSHKDWTVQVSALNVLECVLAEWKMAPAVEIFDLPKELLSSGGFFSNKRNNEEILGPSWLLSKILNNLGYLHGERGSLNVQIPNPLRIKSFQLLSVLALHFKLLGSHLNSVATAFEEALMDSQFEIRLMASKCLDAVVYQMGAILESDKTTIDTCANFWVRILPSIVRNIELENELCGVKIALVDAISNIGAIAFENLPQFTRISLLSFLTGFCSETTADVIIRANVVRTLSIFVTFSSMRNNLVFIENTSDLLLRLSNVRNISVRIKVIWSMGNISDALLENSLESFNERISDEIFWSLIRQAVAACDDNDKVRCNAVRAIGNLMRLLCEKHFFKDSDRALIKFAISKLVEGIRSSGTSKVKWNSCYAIGNVIQNETIFLCMEKYKDISWKRQLYSSICQAICSNSNYKVKINAAIAALHISKQTHIEGYCIVIWETTIKAIEQSHNLENFYEYNHRDVLQEQLCLLLCHTINFATLDNYIMFSRTLLERTEMVRNTWIRVTRRMIPEKSAPLLACSSHLYAVLKSEQLNLEHKNSIKLILYAIPFNY